MKTKITYKEFKETIAKANELISDITFNELAGTLLKDHNLESMLLAKRSCHGGLSEYLPTVTWLLLLKLKRIILTTIISMIQL